LMAGADYKARDEAVSELFSGSDDRKLGRYRFLSSLLLRDELFERG
jgi:hypothetical protein